jgi:hypothetical protein
VAQPRQNEDTIQKITGRMQTARLIPKDQPGGAVIFLVFAEC